MDSSGGAELLVEVPIGVARFSGIGGALWLCGVGVLFGLPLGFLISVSVGIVDFVCAVVGVLFVVFDWEGLGRWSALCVVETVVLLGGLGGTKALMAFLT